MASSDDSTLIKIAIFGFAMSIFCTAGLTVMLSDQATSDYSFDEINEYRTKLSSFTGESMLSSTPWVLSGVYTPWSSADGVANHIDDDGWLYGQSITPLNQFYDDTAAIIHLDPEYKSNRLLTTGEDVSDEVITGIQWWYENTLTRGLGQTLQLDPYVRTTMTGSTWDYQGYRYVLDPCLPFLDENGEYQTSSRDGALSLVWYTFNGQEGLSGGLDVYGGKVLLASYSATDIISGYNEGGGTATTYDFDFNGVHLNLSIRFDPVALENGKTLMQAWTNGDWEMAVTSTSAGMFLDVQNSNSYAVSVGSLISTFTQIYTFSMPNIDNGLLAVVLWLMVGLPMTLALALLLMRVTQAVKPL